MFCVAWNFSQIVHVQFIRSLLVHDLMADVPFPRCRRLRCSDAAHSIRRWDWWRRRDWASAGPYRWWAPFPVGPDRPARKSTETGGDDAEKWRSGGGEREWVVRRSVSREDFLQGAAPRRLVGPQRTKMSRGDRVVCLFAGACTPRWRRGVHWGPLRRVDTPARRIPAESRGFLDCWTGLPPWWVYPNDIWNPNKIAKNKSKFDSIPADPSNLIFWSQIKKRFIFKFFNWISNCNVPLPYCNGMHHLLLYCSLFLVGILFSLAVVRALRFCCQIKHMALQNTPAQGYCID